MSTNPLFWDWKKEINHRYIKIAEVWPYWLAVTMLAATCGSLGAGTLLFFQNYRLQNPIIIKYQCMVCKLEITGNPGKPTPTPGKPGRLNYKIDASGESKLIQ